MQDPKDFLAVGIDLGSAKTVLATAKNAKLQVLSNEANFRETPSVVGFGPQQRNIGEAGLLKAKTNFRDTIAAPMRFLTNDVNQLKTNLSFVSASANILEGDSATPKTLFKVRYQEGEEILVPEQVMAAFLSHCKHILNINKVRYSDIVLSVPSYFTQYERKALLTASKIADMPVSRLLNESTAVCLDYGVFRLNEFDPVHPKNILFIDFGYSKLSAFVGSFTSNKIAVVAQKNCKNLGCRNMDRHLLEFYRTEFRKSSGLDIMDNKKATLKLLENIEKQRKVLSANSEHSINLEYLMEENDFNYTLKRDDFDRLIQPVIADIFLALQQFKFKLDTKNIQIDGIELIGGASRIPLFMRTVQNLFKMDLGRGLNASETIAQGCALMGVIQSPFFKKSDLIIQELSDNTYECIWNILDSNKGNALGMWKLEEYPETNKVELFPKGCTLNTVNSVRFSTREDIEVLILENSKVVSHFVTDKQNTQKEIEGDTVLKLGFDQNGILDIQGFYLQNRHSEAQQQTHKTKIEPQFAIPFSTTEVVPKLSEELEFFIKKESEMLRRDYQINNIYESKNMLESAIYAQKERLRTDRLVQEWLSPADTQQISSLLEATKEWVYSEEANTASSESFQIRKKELETAIQSLIQERQKYRQGLMSKVQECEKIIDKYMNWLRSTQTRYLDPKLKDQIFNLINTLNYEFIRINNELKKAKKHEAVADSEVLGSKMEETQARIKELLDTYKEEQAHHQPYRGQKQHQPRYQQDHRSQRQHYQPHATEVPQYSSHHENPYLHTGQGYNKQPQYGYSHQDPYYRPQTEGGKYDNYGQGLWDSPRTRARRQQQQPRGRGDGFFGNFSNFFNSFW